MRVIKHFSPKDHKGSCVPLALASVLNQSYDQANVWLQKRGYRESDRTGTFMGGMNMAELGFQRVPYERNLVKLPGESISRFVVTINQFQKVARRGVYLIGVYQHLLAMKDGIAYDTKISMKSRIQDIWVRTRECLPHDWPTVEQVTPKPQRGEKRKQLLELIAQGINEPSELSRKSGTSYVYARSVILSTKQNTQ